MTPTDETLLFVYGTLKRGCSNHPFLAEQRFLGEARTLAGFRLYNLGDYPGMVRVPEDRDGVLGEVWSVSPEALRQLDNLEGTDLGLYRREKVPLDRPFAEDEVESYLYQRPTEGRPEVGSIWTE